MKTLRMIGAFAVGYTLALGVMVVSAMLAVALVGADPSGTVAGQAINLAGSVVALAVVVEHCGATAKQLDEEG